MTEPTTPTGKRYDWRTSHERDISDEACVTVPFADILAIEREAAQQERERLRALVDVDLVEGDPSDYWTQRQVYLWVMDDLLVDPEDDA